MNCPPLLCPQLILTWLSLSLSLPSKYDHREINGFFFFFLIRTRLVGLSWIELNKRKFLVEFLVDFRKIIIS